MKDGRWGRGLFSLVAAILLPVFLSTGVAAQRNTPQTLPQGQEVSLKQEGWGLGCEQALVVRGNEAGKQAAPVPLAKLEEFYPGDLVLIPVVKGSYQQTPEGQTFQPAASPVEYFQRREVPRNWELASQTDALWVEEPCWRWGEELGAGLLVEVRFPATAAAEEGNWTQLDLWLRDRRDDTRSAGRLEGLFQNPVREVTEGGLDRVLSPMVMVAGEGYAGGAVSFSFGDGVVFRDTGMEPGQRVCLNLDCSYDNRLANQLRAFELRFYNFLGEADHFPRPGRLSFPAERQEAYVYEMIDGIPRRLQAEYDENTDQVTIVTDHLGYYIVSAEELGR